MSNSNLHAPQEAASLRFLFVIAFFHIFDKIREPVGQGGRHDLVFLLAEPEAAHWGLGLAGIQAQKIAGIIVEEGNPGGVPAGRCGIVIEVPFGRQDLVATHQQPILFKPADEIISLAIVPGQKLAQISGQS